MSGSTSSKARLVKPPHTIKIKIGSGGIDQTTLDKAEDVIQNNEIDFKPIALRLLAELDAALGSAQINALLAPAAQFKAQGPMLRFPLIGEIGSSLIDFLEGIEAPVSPEAREIIAAHRQAIAAVLAAGLRTADTPQGRELMESLAEACARYRNKFN